MFEEQAPFEQALLSLELYPSLYGATFLQPTDLWDARSLQWMREGPDNPTVSAWISRALASGAFRSESWFEALEEAGNPRLQGIFAEWANSDIQVSDALSASHSCSSRFFLLATPTLLPSYGSPS